MIPSGSIRSRIMATKRTAISPITEVDMVAITPSIVPNRDEAEIVPRSGKLPPEITVTKDFAI